MASPKLAAGDGSYDFHVRSLYTASQDSAAAADPSSDPNLLQSVRRVCEMCQEAKGASDEMVARAFPVMSKLFQRCAAAPTLFTASSGVLLLFFLDFGEVVLHDANTSLRTFFRSCLRWPPELTARIRCRILRQQGAKAEMQAVHGNHPKNQTVD